MGLAVFWNRQEQQFFVDLGLQRLLHRRCELRGTVTRLLRAAKVEDDEADYRSWAESYRIRGMNATQLAEVGGDDYRELMSRLAGLQMMVSGYMPTVVDDLCDLPLETIRQRNVDLIAAEDAKKAAALEQAKLERMSWVRTRAREVLQEEATGWLAQSITGCETSNLDFAGQSDENLQRVQYPLNREGEARRRRIAAERELAEFHDRLESAAKAVFPNQEFSDLFLKAAHPRLGGSRPLEYCRSEKDFSLIVSLMPKKR